MRRVKKRWERKARQIVALISLFLFGIGFPERIFATTTPETNSAALFKELTSLDPHPETNLFKLAQLAVPAVKIGRKKSKAEKKLKRNADDLKDLSWAELRNRFTDDSAKYETRSFEVIGRLATEALQAKDAATRNSCVTNILEVQAGLRNSRQPPVPEKLGVITTWLFFFKNLSGTIGHGETLATDLAEPVPHGNDDGRTDPASSTFWERPKDISQEDLYAGFGRRQLPGLDGFVCEYDGPKTSSGTHAGFDVERNGERFKIKFGDLNSEPFTARIFYALGYHADPTDCTPGVRLRYDRRLFREFHLRKPLTMRITPFGVHVGSVQLQAHYDPFAFVTSAVFKDGRKMSGAEFKQMLFVNPDLSHPEDSPENFRTNVEATVDYLVMAPANVQPHDGPTQSIGSWEFSGLGHESRRELRGAGLLAAWLAWFDSRGDNTKLRLERDTDEVRLQHFISDLGGGMGTGTGLFSPQGENPNDFTWTFTEPEIVRGPHQMTTPFRIEHFRPVVPTEAFAEMTMDDARWMARLIGQLTENQLREALIASGYDNAESRLYLEKLVSRRDRMIRDLKLEDEIPLLRPEGQNRRLNYSPVADGPFNATLPDGRVVSARTSGKIIADGKIDSWWNALHVTAKSLETP